MEYYTHTGMTQELETLNSRMQEKKKLPLSNTASSKRSFANTQSVSPNIQRRAVTDLNNPSNFEGDQGLRLPNYYSVYNQSQNFGTQKKNEPRSSKLFGKPRRSIHIESGKATDNFTISGIASKNKLNKAKKKQNDNEEGQAQCRLENKLTVGGLQRDKDLCN